MLFIETPIFTRQVTEILLDKKNQKEDPTQQQIKALRRLMTEWLE